MDEKLTKYLQDEKYDLALRFINKAISRDNCFENYNTRAIIYLYLKKYKAAIIELEKLNLKYRNNSDILCNLGIAYRGNKESENAISSLKKSLSITPNNINSLLNLIESYIDIFKFDDALLVIDKIISMKPNFERGFQLKAFCYKELNKFEDHHECLINAIKINNQNYLNFYHLGFSFLWKKDIANAINSFQECFRLNNQFIPALNQLNAIKKFTSSSNEFKQILELNEKNLDNQNLAYKKLLISDIFYNSKKYDNFFEYLQQANNLKNSLIKYKPIDISIIKNLFKTLQPYEFDISSPDPIFIIGMPRTGSSLIEQVLSRSEDVYAVGEIPLLHELFNNYFISNKNSLNIETLSKIRSKYLDFLSQFSSDKRYIIDKLPLNFFWVGFIKYIFPNAKFIHSIRNKTDTCMSLYRTFFAKGVLEFAYDQKHISNFYSSYREMISFWKSNDFNLIDIDYDYVVDNPKLIFKNLFETLELQFDESFIELDKINRPVKTASYLQITNKLMKNDYPDWAVFKEKIPLFF